MKFKLLKLNSLEHDGDSLSATDAGRADSQLFSVLSHLVNKMSGDAGAGSGQGMTEGDGATGGVEFLHGIVKFLKTSQGLCAEGLVDLQLVHGAEALAGLLAHGADGGHGTEAHDGGLAAGNSVAHDAGQRSESVLGDGFLGGEDDGRGAVTDSGGGAGGHDATLLENGGQFGQGLEGGFGLGMLVGVKHLDALLGLDLDGGDLVLEDALFVGLGPLLLGAEGESVHLLASETVLGGQVLGGDAHGRVGVGVGEGGPHHVLQLGVDSETGAEANVPGGVGAGRHVVGSAGQHDVGVSEKDLLGAVDDGLESGAAETVHDQGGGLHSQAALEGHVAGQVGRVRAGGGEHVADARGVHALWGQVLCRGDGGVGGQNGEVGGGVGLEGAAERAEGRALGRHHKDGLRERGAQRHDELRGFNYEIGEEFGLLPGRMRS